MILSWCVIIQNTIFMHTKKVALKRHKLTPQSWQYPAPNNFLKNQQFNRYAERRENKASSQTNKSKSVNTEKHKAS